METISRFVGKVWRRLFSIPEKIKEPEQPLPVDTFCPVCNWSGNYTLTLLRDKYNDSCPECGNGYLDYLI